MFDCSRRTILIRNYCWSADFTVKSNQGGCHIYEELLHTSATNVHLQKQLTDAFKGCSLEASPCHLLHRDFDIKAYCENIEQPHRKAFHP